MNRITITLTLDLPEGVTPSVDYGTAPAATVPVSPQPAAAAPPPAAGWVCPIHHVVKTVPAGTSKKTGKPYAAFLACAEQGCDQKPPRGQGPAQYTPAPADGSQFDDLPFA